MFFPSSNENSTLQETAQPTVQPNQNKVYLKSKRIIDFIFSLLGMIVLSPLFVFVGCLIKWEDPRGPILFKQIRMGKNGQLFYMYKFRSMISNAEALKEQLIDQNEATGPVFKMKQDPRVTKVGRFIRKTSIDELPQLLNVLKGEMSLVGPRPPLPEEVEKYSPYERQRITVQPGLTCYWQVSGRSNVSFERWVELDLKYIKERNFFIDMKLIFKTFFVLFGSKDAY